MQTPPNYDPQFITYVNALSTAAVALLAGVQVSREILAGNRRRRAVDARVGVQAFVLYQEISSWVLDEPWHIKKSNGDVPAWLTLMGTKLRYMEPRVIALAEQAPEASAKVTRQLEALVVHFRGTVVDIQRLWSWQAQNSEFARAYLDDPEDGLLHCLRCLDAVIPPQIRAADDRRSRALPTASDQRRRVPLPTVG